MLAGTRMRENFAFHLSDDGKLVAIEYLTPYVTPASCAEYKKVRALASYLSSGCRQEELVLT